MWTKSRSLLLTIIITAVLLFTVTVFAFLAPWIVQFYIDTFNRVNVPVTELLVCFYCCVPFCYVALTVLLGMLLNLRKNRVFTRGNILRMRILSWCSFAIAAICLIGGIWYLPFIIVGGAIGFIGIIIRVIKAMLACGFEMKNDQELTI